MAHAWHPESAGPCGGVGAKRQSWDQVQQVADTVEELDIKR